MAFTGTIPKAMLDWASLIAKQKHQNRSAIGFVRHY
jgi:hypothetical protein